MSVTDEPFLLATEATPIDSAHSMYNACRSCAFCLCVQPSGLVDINKHVLNNARHIYLARLAIC